MLTACYVSKLKWHHPYPINSVCCARLIRIRDRAGSQKKVLTCILHFPSLFFRLIVICSDAPIHQNISFHSSVYYLGTVESQTMTSAYRLFLMKNNLHRFWFMLFLFLVTSLKNWIPPPSSRETSHIQCTTLNDLSQQNQRIRLSPYWGKQPFTAVLPICDRCLG